MRDAQRTGDVIRSDVQNARKILADGGLQGLKDALASGALLPAAIVSVLSPSLLSGSSPDNQQQENF